MTDCVVFLGGQSVLRDTTGNEQNFLYTKTKAVCVHICMPYHSSWETYRVQKIQIQVQGTMKNVNLIDTNPWSNGHWNANVPVGEKLRSHNHSISIKAALLSCLTEKREQLSLWGKLACIVSVHLLYIYLFLWSFRLFSPHWTITVEFQTQTSISSIARWWTIILLVCSVSHTVTLK